MASGRFETPIRMNARVRPAAVAGMFYPSDPGVLRAEVGRLLETARASRAANVIQANWPTVSLPKGILAPHAGYKYSGAIAASAFAALDRAAIRRIVLLGPAHHLAFRGLAAPDCVAFATPLGNVAVDLEALQRISDLPQVSVSAAAHEAEHSLEVELPFLQVLGIGAPIVPLVVGDSSPGEVAEVLDRLWGDESTIVLLSSDLSHYLSQAEAMDVDRATAEQILALGGPLSPSQACGARPLNGFLEVARRRGMHATLLDLRTSADTAGDPHRVVGYGAFAFHDG
jgi:AmmeMemoRadiSam system protein B